MRKRSRPSTRPTPASSLRAAIVSAYGAPPEPGERAEPHASEARRSSSCSRPRSTPPTSRSRPVASRPGARRSRTSPGSKASAGSCSPPASREGTRVWASGRGLGVARDGAFGERFVVADETLVEVPEAASDLVAAALGQVGLAAWMSLSWLAPVRPGEVVLVLGATGSVGSVAVQVAKLLGAEPRRRRRARPGPARGRTRRSGPTRPSRSRATTSRSAGGAVDGRSADARARPALWPGARGRDGRRRPGSTDRPRRPVGGAHRHLRLGVRAWQAAADPRLLELRGPARRTRAGLRGRRRARGGRPAPPRRRGAAARSRRRRRGSDRRVATTSSSCSSRDRRRRRHSSRSRWPSR